VLTWGTLLIGGSAIVRPLMKASNGAKIATQPVRRRDACDFCGLRGKKLLVRAM
jgi:hypothetical protein